VCNRHRQRRAAVRAVRPRRPVAQLLREGFEQQRHPRGHPDRGRQSWAWRSSLQRARRR
jgi:hypothetical protein